MPKSRDAGRAAGRVRPELLKLAGIPHFYLKPVIPERMIATAVATYASDARPGEIEGLFADGKSGKADRGFLVTADRLYFLDPFGVARSVAFAAASEARVHGKVLYLNGWPAVDLRRLYAGECGVVQRFVGAMAGICRNRPETPAGAAKGGRTGAGAAPFDSLRLVARHFRWLARIPRLYLRPDIPPKKLSGAITGYAFDADPEDVLLLIDATLFGGAGNGMLVTSRGVYTLMLGGRPRYFGADEIWRVETEGRNLLINGEKVVEIFSGEVAASVIAYFVSDLRASSKGLEGVFQYSPDLDDADSDLITCDNILSFRAFLPYCHPRTPLDGFQSAGADGLLGLALDGRNTVDLLPPMWDGGADLKPFWLPLALRLADGHGGSLPALTALFILALARRFQESLLEDPADVMRIVGTSENVAIETVKHLIYRADMILRADRRLSAAGCHAVSAQVYYNFAAPFYLHLLDIYLDGSELETARQDFFESCLTRPGPEVHGGLGGGKGGRRRGRVSEREGGRGTDMDAGRESGGNREKRKKTDAAIEGMLKLLFSLPDDASGLLPDFYERVVKAAAGRQFSRCWRKDRDVMFCGILSRKTSYWPRGGPKRDLASRAVERAVREKKGEILSRMEAFGELADGLLGELLPCLVKAAVANDLNVDCSGFSFVGT
ncbi:MAG: hypothetical protein LBR80_17265 [Deltaproteobacteria bacterium]|jgi:hypothetical protein|nr:hypothetical protein [Deltaproteobacteria bacterium]